LTSLFFQHSYWLKWIVDSGYLITKSLHDTRTINFQWWLTTAGDPYFPLQSLNLGKHLVCEKSSHTHSCTHILRPRGRGLKGEHWTKAATNCQSRTGIITILVSIVWWECGVNLCDSCVKKNIMEFMRHCHVSSAGGHASLDAVLGTSSL